MVSVQSRLGEHGPLNFGSTVITSLEKTFQYKKLQCFDVFKRSVAVKWIVTVQIMDRNKATTA